LLGIAHRVVHETRAPFLDGDGEQVRQQRQFPAHGVLGLIRQQAFIAVIRDQVRSVGREALRPEEFVRGLGRLAVGIGCARALGVPETPHRWRSSALLNSSRSAPLRSKYTPRTIWSSVRGAQSLASRRVRKVLIAFSQLCLRTTAFDTVDKTALDVSD
jgi:hypothetical protein